jgi:hypothetical protein
VGCALQFSDLWDTCFCNVQLKDMLSHRLGLAYDIMVIQRDIVESLFAPWAGGVVLGFGFVSLFVFVLCLGMNPEP